MTKDEGFNLLKVQTIILKVNLHCDGCKQKVKKLLLRTEGVYTVSIDAEHQKVTVTGNVGSAILIKKLAKSGKPAHVWFQNSNQNPTKDGSKNNNNTTTTTASNKDQAPSSNQSLLHGLKAFKKQHGINLESLSSDEEDENVCSDNDDDDDDNGELDFLKQTLENATSQTAGKIPNGSDPKGGSVAPISHGLVVGGINSIGGEAKKSSGGFPEMVKFQENQSHPSAMMMNLMQQQVMQQEPQAVMMYNRATQVPNYTGYYYPYTPYVTTHQPGSFSDESTSSCSVM